jgi:predicted NAD-dependent protein-ADP-ribosyltransferase YbiA (DUF1768 family)
MVFKVDFRSDDPAAHILSIRSYAPIEIREYGRKHKVATMEKLFYMVRSRGYWDRRKACKARLTERTLGMLGESPIYWEDKRINYGSSEHLQLLEEFVWMKFEQNPEARAALLSTGDEEIVCEDEAEGPRPPIEGWSLCCILTDIRTYYRKEGPSVGVLQMASP